MSLETANTGEAELKDVVSKLQIRMTDIATELRDTEDSHRRAEQEAILRQQSYDNHLAAMPQGDLNASQPWSTLPQPAASNFDATVQFAFLVETGAGAAMSLVSRAVAAAIRTPTAAALYTATQERVKYAIRALRPHSTC